MATVGCFWVKQALVEFLKESRQHDEVAVVDVLGDAHRYVDPSRQARVPLLADAPQPQYHCPASFAMMAIELMDTPPIPIK
ncbi:MAG: hypothetical protein U5N86_01570 [Planctomycetota bacterium]|nr:hypothetical protein [Planctomycetota bacterium]